MTTTVRGVAQTKAALARVSAEVALAAPQASEQGGHVVARNMRPPHDTGALAGGIGVQSDGATARVGSTVAYDRFVQQGTQNMNAQPYGLQAAQSSTSGVIAAIAAVLKSAIR